MQKLKDTQSALTRISKIREFQSNLEYLSKVIVVSIDHWRQKTMLCSNIANELKYGSLINLCDGNIEYVTININALISWLDEWSQTQEKRVSITDPNYIRMMIRGLNYMFKVFTLREVLVTDSNLFGVDPSLFKGFINELFKQIVGCDNNPITSFLINFNSILNYLYRQTSPPTDPTFKKLVDEANANYVGYKYSILVDLCKN